MVELDGLVFDSVAANEGPAFTLRTVGALIVDGGATAAIRDSTFIGRGQVQIVDGSDPVIERNVFTEGASILGDFGGGVVRENLFIDSFGTAIELIGTTATRVEANQISGAAIAISMENDADTTDAAAMVIGNTISGSPIGIILAPGSVGEIRGNTITSAAQAITLDDSETIVADNDLDGNLVGIRVLGGARYSMGTRSSAGRPVSNCRGNRTCALSVTPSVTTRRTSSSPQARRTRTSATTTSALTTRDDEHQRDVDSYPCRVNGQALASRPPVRPLSPTWRSVPYRAAAEPR